MTENGTEQAGPTMMRVARPTRLRIDAIQSRLEILLGRGLTRQLALAAIVDVADQADDAILLAALNRAAGDAG